MFQKKLNIEKLDTLESPTSSPLPLDLSPSLAGKVKVSRLMSR